MNGTTTYKQNKTIPFGTSEAKQQIAKNLDLVEFGGTVKILKSVLHDEASVTAAYAMVIDDFLKSKKKHFPDWHELPEIKINSNMVDGRGVAWYIAVPRSEVWIDGRPPQTADEEALWDE